MFSSSLLSGLVILALSSSVFAAPNFGSCSTPQIKFAAGLDGRKETSFAPVDTSEHIVLVSYKVYVTNHCLQPESFNHGSADDIGTIASFICQQLQTSCKANSDANNLCQSATSAANKAAAGTGAQADAFNAVFGLKTNFAKVAVVNSNGQTVTSSSSSSSSSSTASQDPQSTTSKPMGCSLCPNRDSLMLPDN